MTEIAPILATYGLPGALLAVVACLLWKLLDRGFVLQVPPKRGGH